MRGYDGGTKPLYPLVDAPVFSQHGGAIPTGGTSLTMTHSNPGTSSLYYTTDGTDPRIVGGGVATSARLYSAALPLDGWTTTMKARVLDGSDWSALAEAVFFRSDPPPLAVTEILAIPLPPSPAEAAAGFADKDDFEFIELMNTGLETLNLRDIRFVNGIDCTLSDVILAPGERGVVVRNLAVFRARYGGGPSIVGSFSLNLADAGEPLALISASGAILSEFAFDTSAPWSVGPPGTSLVLRDPGLDPEDGASWRSSLSVGGSPAAAEGTTYAAWKEKHGILDDTTDSDVDGLGPFLEYVSGGDPMRPDAAPYPSIDVSDGYVLVSYTHALEADDVTARLMQSADLSAWVPANVEPVSSISGTDGSEVVTLRLPSPSGAHTFLSIHWQTRP